LSPMGEYSRLRPWIISTGSFALRGAESGQERGGEYRGISLGPLIPSPSAPEPPCILLITLDLYVDAKSDKSALRSVKGSI
jgi:hypothetical protein